MDAKAEISGSNSRIHAQKSLGIKFKKKNNPALSIFFPGIANGDSHLRWIIARNTGNDFEYARIRDAFIHKVVDRYLPDLDTLASQPVVTYINGKYYGFQNIREKSNEHYLQDHYRTEDLTAVKNSVKFDGKDDFDHAGYFNNFINTLNSLGGGELKQYLEQNVDLEQMYQYYIIETFMANEDWPDNNIRIYRILDPASPRKWRYVLFDTDVTLNIQYVVNFDENMDQVNHPTLQTAMNAQQPVGQIFKKAMQVPELKEAFKNRYNQFLDNVSASQMKAVLDGMTPAIRSEMARHFMFERYKKPWYSDGGAYWDGHLSHIKNFIDRRHGAVRNMVANF